MVNIEYGNLKVPKDKNIPQSRLPASLPEPEKTTPRASFVI